MAAPGQLSEAYTRTETWTSDLTAVPPEALLAPRGVTVDPFDGRVFVVDSGNKRVQVFEPDGTFVRSIGHQEPGPGALDDPVDVAVQGSIVFVTDRGLDRVVLYSLDGDHLGDWPQLSEPWGIATALDGRVLVVENDASTIAVFNARGDRLDTWAGFGEAIGRLNRPRGIDVAADGRTFVTDTGNERLVVLDRAGDQVNETIGLGSRPIDLALSTDGEILVAYDDGTLERHDDLAGLPRVASPEAVAGVAGVGAGPSTEVYATFADDDRPMHGVRAWRDRPLAVEAEWGDVPAPLGRIDAPHRISAGSDVLVADSWRRVQRFDLDGGVLGQVAAGQANDHASAGAGGVGADVFVAGDTSISRLDADGVARWRYDLPTTGSDYAWAVALDYDPDGNRLAALDLGGQRLRYLSADGSETGGWSFRPAPGASVPLWDLSGSGDDVFVVNRSSDSLERRDAATGAVVDAWRVPGRPLRVAAGPAGEPFVLNRHGWVLKYGPTGDLRAAWRAGEAGHPSSRPVDLGVDDRGRVLVADAGLDRIEIYALDPAAAPGEVPSFEPTCEAIGDKQADPTRLALGDTTTITLRVDGRCPSLTPQNDVVLVIDHSGSMSVETKMDDAKDAANAFLDAVDMGIDRVGVVGFNQEARLLQEMTGNRSNARAAIDDLTAAGGTDIAAGVDEARRELTGPRRRTDASSVVVLLTDGGSAVQPALRAAEQARLEGARLFTIGFGTGANTALLEDMASTPDDYYFAPTGPDLVTIYRTIAERIAADVLFSTLVVTDLLPVNMDYVAGSGVPTPEISGRQLTWRLSDVPLSGMSLQYRVVPTEVGTWPTNVFATGEGTDGLGQQGRVDFPIPEVTVVAPTVTPTGTAPPTMTPTATPRLSPTPTTPPRPIYMPMARKDPCPKRYQHVDVVLVVDTSDSMLAPASDGRTKLDAARGAARAFVRLLDLSQDAAAVVYFHTESNVLQPLTRDRAALESALDGLPQHPGTRIDRGLEAAADAMRGPGRHVENLPVVIVLTDGRPSGVSGAAVLRAADRLKSAGIVLYVIGLGADVDPVLLSEMASDEASYFFAPDAEALRTIYTRIARELPCRRP